MAGNYPDVPAPRMAYDRDGTVGLRMASDFLSIVSTYTQTEIEGLNDESGTIVGSFPCLVFPQLRDIVGYTVTHNGFGRTMYTSVDTTNGVDGTWVDRGYSLPEVPGFSVVGLRQNIQTVSWTGIKAVRFTISNYSGNWHSVHLYGSISAGQTPDRLRMWHPTLDEPLDDNTAADGAYFDWGDVQRNTTSDKTFRIKNNSATLTANGVVISQQTLTDTTPTVNSQFTFSDGGAFAASIDIGNLSPGAISPVITKRYTRPSNATLSLWTSRTIANPTSWT